MFNLSNGGGLMASFSDRLQSLLNAYDTAENVAVAILSYGGDSEPDEGEVEYLADQISSWESGDISKYDVEEYKSTLDDIHSDIMSNNDSYVQMSINAMVNKREDKREEIQQAMDEGVISESRGEAELANNPQYDDEEIEDAEYWLERARETNAKDDWAMVRELVDS